MTETPLWVISFMEDEATELRAASVAAFAEGNPVFAERLRQSAEAYNIVIRRMKQKAASDSAIVCHTGTISVS